MLPVLHGVTSHLQIIVFPRRMEEWKPPSDKLISADKQIKKTGLVLVGLTGVFAVGLTVVSAPFVLPAFRKFCLPYVPATNVQVRNVLSALGKKKGTSLVDLGSGDGRIVSRIFDPGFDCL